MPSSGASWPVSATRLRQSRYSVRVIHSSTPKRLTSQPAGHSHMIGMKMGDNYAPDRPVLHDARKELLPGFRGRLVAQARVYHGPTIVVFEQPEIDVVQLE